MPTLTIPQTAQLAVNAGIPQGYPLYVCVSIAMAESSLRTDVVSPPNDNGTLDYGLWEINSSHDDMLPGQDRLDPNVNARLMAMLSSNGTNWQPWTTYWNGDYLTYMGQVTGELTGKTIQPGAGVSGVPPQGAGNGLVVENAALVTQSAGAKKDLTENASGIEKFFHLITTADGWLRILKVAVGAMAVFMGLYMLFSSTPTGKAVNHMAVKGAEAAVLA